MKYFLLFITVAALTSCWKLNNNGYDNFPQTKVWGSRPVYASFDLAKYIHYIPDKQPLRVAGNIYAYGKFIFQVDVGRGIHVIDNTDPAKADRIGFITVNGCAQVSIKQNYLYTNSYADLVTIDISDPTNIKESSRIPNQFPEFAYNYPLIQPAEKGFYTCPIYDSLVVGWVKDSIYATCNNN